ncbi:hypothetical protein PIB30_095153, partial [Stylosanthes scabra]|nr:hypothetical protein [Stylosanthes scabra]
EVLPPPPSCTTAVAVSRNPIVALTFEAITTITFVFLFVVVHGGSHHAPCRRGEGKNKGEEVSSNAVASVFHPCFTTAAVLRKPSLLGEPATIDVGGPVERRGPATTRPWLPLRTKPPCFCRRESITVSVAAVTELPAAAVAVYSALVASRLNCGFTLVYAFAGWRCC